MKKIGGLYRLITVWNEKVSNSVTFDTHLSLYMMWNVKFDNYKYFLTFGTQVQLKTQIAIHAKM